MTLLLDANLSHRMLPRLRDAFPGVSHVREHGLLSASDGEIWEFARARDLTILTRDADFLERSVLRTIRRTLPPPKVIRLSLGNASTAEVLEFLLAAEPQIRSFLSDRERPHIELWKR